MKIDLNSYGFKWDDLFMIDFEINASFDAFKKLNDNIEKSLDESKKELDDIIEAKRNYYNALTDEEREGYIYQMHYEDEVVIAELQKYQRYSMVLSIYSFYEAKLKQICLEIENEFNLEKKLENIKTGKGDLYNYWTYLKDVYEISVDDVQNFFTPINKQKAIRNFIAHEAGEIHNVKFDSLPQAEGITYRNFETVFFLEIEKDIYIKNLLKTAIDFFNNLLRAVDNRYKELKENAA